MVLSKYQLLSKCQWIGTLDYNGEDCEVFFQYDTIYLVLSTDIINKELSNVTTIFDALI